MEAQPFEIRTNDCHFVKYHLKSRQKHMDFEWFGFRMVGTKAMAKLNHLESDLQEVRISNVSGLQMVGFQISTVFQKQF